MRGSIWSQCYSSCQSCLLALPPSKLVCSLFLLDGFAIGDSFMSHHQVFPLASSQPVMSAALACWATSGVVHCWDGYQRALLRHYKTVKKERPFPCCGLTFLGLFDFSPPFLSTETGIHQLHASINHSTTPAAVQFFR